jgi:translation initiation factor 2 alpha subunit (eIF-2alpha)
MLTNYDQQLVSARRLARYLRAIRMTDPEQREIMRQYKRRQLIERVSREIIDNLLVTGAQTPIIEDIRQDLEKEYGHSFVFDYPFMEQELQIYRQVNGDHEKLSPEETNKFLGKLWEITLSKVDETML